MMIDKRIQDYINFGCDFCIFRDEVYIVPHYDKPISNWSLIFSARDLIFKKESKDIRSLLVRFKCDYTKEIIYLPPKTEIILQHLLKEINKEKMKLVQ